MLHLGLIENTYYGGEAKMEEVAAQEVVEREIWLHISTGVSLTISTE
jgi:hypothetical protein